MSLYNKMNINQFYCVKCRKRVTLKPDDIRIARFNNKKVGRKIPAMVGNCRLCDTTVCKFIPVDDENKLTEQYGKYQSHNTKIGFCIFYSPNKY